MRKKVIEQENDYPIEIEIQKDGENDGVFMTQSTSSFDYDNIWINQENATTVAKAIDPEYQKVIDQNAKLVEDVDRLLELRKISDLDYDKLKIRCDIISTALRELVDLKYVKDMDGKTPYYLERQPIAWNNAIEALQNTKNIEG